MVETCSNKIIFGAAAATITEEVLGEWAIIIPEGVTNVAVSILTCGVLTKILVGRTIILVGHTIILVVLTTTHADLTTLIITEVIPPVCIINIAKAMRITIIIRTSNNRDRVIKTDRVGFFHTKQLIYNLILFSQKFASSLP